MRTHLFLILTVLGLGPLSAAAEQLPAESLPDMPPLGQVTYAETSTAPSAASDQALPLSGSVPKSSLVTRVDMQLSDKILHANEINYHLPTELADVASKCQTVDTEECFFLYKPYENVEQPDVAAQANLELSVLSLQRGQVKQALAYIDRAAQLAPEDPFIELTRGWTLFAAGKYKKARRSFADMLYLTADFEYASSAKLGTALAYYFEKNYKAAAKEFQYIYTSNPYAISFAAYMMGRIAAADKTSRKLAPVFLQQALSHDSHQYPALQTLAALSEQDKTKPLASFQYYSTLYSVDPSNAYAKKQLTHYGEKLSRSSQSYLFYLRLEQPIVQKFVPTPSAAVNMALYADRWQQPVALQRAAVMPAGIMTISDERLGEVLKSPSFVTRLLVFNEETKSVDVQDNRGHVEFSTRRPFMIRSDKPGKTLLVKDVAAADIFAADLSDKELTGSLQVIPTENGLLLINQTQVEDLIPSLLATQAAHVKDPAALRALAVVFRGALQETVSRPTDKPYHITDNDVYFKSKGINLTVLPMLQATQQSRGLELSGQGLGYYASCGTVAADQIGNTKDKPPYHYSPANLSKYMLSSPPADLYAAPDDPTHWSAVKWMYLYNAKDITARLNDRTEFGSLRAIVPLKRSPNGRLQAIRFEGSKGSYEATTEQEILYIISAGTMRSAFFDWVPLYKGKNIAHLLVRGYDTGTGVGLCVDGAEGLARRGRDYLSIIKYYFPDARILDRRTGELH